MLAVNSDGNMPYDLCEDGPTLDYIESEMARRGLYCEDYRAALCPRHFGPLQLQYTANRVVRLMYPKRLICHVAHTACEPHTVTAQSAS